MVGFELMAEKEGWRKDQIKVGSRIVVRGRGFKILKFQSSKLVVVCWRGSMW